MDLNLTLELNEPRFVLCRRVSFCMSGPELRLMSNGCDAPTPTARGAYESQTEKEAKCHVDNDILNMGVVTLGGSLRPVAAERPHVIPN